MCPKCELKSYFDPEKQDVCDVCLGTLQIKSKSKKHVRSTAPTNVQEPIRYNGRAIFFVFQNKEFQEEFTIGVIKTPYYDKGGLVPHHWLRLTNVKKGDIILHGINGCVLAISEAKGPCYDFFYKDGSKGRMVDCDYHILNDPLVTDKYRKEIVRYCSKLKYQPFNKNGDGNEGYLFDICREVATFFILDIAKYNSGIETLPFVKDILT